jgi:hypothetical protein
MDAAIWTTIGGVVAGFLGGVPVPSPLSSGKPARGAGPVVDSRPEYPIEGGPKVASVLARLEAIEQVVFKDLEEGATAVSALSPEVESRLTAIEQTVANLVQTVEGSDNTVTTTPTVPPAVGTDPAPAA